MYKLAFMLFVAISAGPASAAVGSSMNNPSKGVSGKTIEAGSAFFEQQKKIEEKLADGESYSEIKDRDREQVQGALKRIASALTRAGTVDALDEKEKAAVFNDQELINNILTQAGEDSRLVCRREKRVGSHRVTTQCTTVGQRRREADESQKALRDNQGIKLPPAS